MTNIFRLHLGGLVKTVKKGDISSLISPFGEVLEIDVIKTKPVADEILSDECRGFAYVNVRETDKGNIEKCIRSYHGTKWMGSTLTVAIAKKSYLERMKQEREEEAKKEKERLKKEKEKERKLKPEKPKKENRRTPKAKIVEVEVQKCASPSRYDIFAPKSVEKSISFDFASPLVPLDKPSIISELRSDPQEKPDQSVPNDEEFEIQLAAEKETAKAVLERMFKGDKKKEEDAPPSKKRRTVEEKSGLASIFDHSDEAPFTFFGTADSEPHKDINIEEPIVEERMRPRIEEQSETRIIRRPLFATDPAVNRAAMYFVRNLPIETLTDEWNQKQPQRVTRLKDIARQARRRKRKH